MNLNLRRCPLMLALILALMLAGCARNIQQEQTPVENNNAGGLRIGYQEGLTVVENPDALQEAVDEMIEKSRDAVGLEYKNEALSDDGLNFVCYIANAARNEYDMFIDIYSDADYTDEIFLSGLMPPGSAFDHITLNRPLDVGNNTVYVAFTQVDEVDGEQVIHAQVLITMQFIVRE